MLLCKFAMLQSFTLITDARSVHLVSEEYQVHDVANTLKRFFRTLHEPLLTLQLRDQWIDKSSE